MNKTEFIALIRLAKKVYNTQQDMLAQDSGYKQMLNATIGICIRLDAQLKAAKGDVHYDWMPVMLHALRNWRVEQKLYHEHQAESRRIAAMVLEKTLAQNFEFINRQYPEVLSNPNTQQTLL